MSLNVTIWMLALTLSQGLAPSADGCTDAGRTVLTRAVAALGRGDYVAAAETVHAAYDAPDTASCRAVRLAAWAWRGWTSAERAAARGGAAEPLADVTAAITAVAAFGPARSEATYAAALLRAAAAAAQDERDEMQVWLDEARALATRLALVGTTATWPLPVDLAEGELWYGVDDYELAEAAFMRALAAHDSAAAWRGLAKARDRRHNRDGACAAYRRVQAWLADIPTPGPLAAEAHAYLLRCTP